MKILVLIMFSICLVGCSITSKDMTSFTELRDFDTQNKTCRTSNQCKLADTTDYYCNQRGVFVYSSAVIFGKNEKHLLNLSQQKVLEDIKARYEWRGGIEECLAVARKKPYGICRKNECEILYTFRRRNH